MPLTAHDNSDMTRAEVFRAQERLRWHGFDPGPLDGIIGPRTNAAATAFKRAIGLVARPYIGPITMAALEGSTVAPDTSQSLPWMREAARIMGWHERADNKRLRNWLASDGHALGDPAVFPWCGDFVETAIRLALPKEGIPANPYWALNWRKFGIPCRPTQGAVASITRNGGGHVALIVGQDAGRYFCLGGNQSNRVSVVPIEKSRFVAASFRWPKTFPEQTIYLPHMTVAGASATNFS